MLAEALRGAFRRAHNATSIEGLSPLDRALARLWGGDSAQSKSGVAVDHQSALRLSAVWRADNLVSDMACRAPLRVLKRDERGGKSPDKSHPAYLLLRRKPNRETNAAVWKKLIVHHHMHYGAGYSYIVRHPVTAAPREIIQLMPDRTRAVRIDGRLWFKTDLRHPDNSTEPRFLRPEDVLHLMGLSFDGIEAYSFIDFAREAIGSSLAVREFAAKFFGQGTVGSGFVEMTGNLGDDETKIEAFRRSFMQQFSGLGAAHKAIILEDGATWKPAHVDPDKAQAVETRKADLVEIANYKNIPPHKVGADTNTSYKSLEAENQSLLDESVDPILVRFEEECHDKLLTEEQKRTESHTIEFDRHALQRIELNRKVQAALGQLNGGLVNLNEARRLFGLPGVEGGEAFRIPANVRLEGEDDRASEAAGSAKPTQPPTPTPPATNLDGQKQPLGVLLTNSAEPAAADLDVAAEAVERIARRACHQAVAAAKKSPAAYTDWLDQLATRERAGALAILSRATGPWRERRPQLATSAAIVDRILSGLGNAFDAPTQPPAAAADLTKNVDQLAAELPARLAAEILSEFAPVNE